MNLAWMVSFLALCLTGIASAVPELEWDRTAAKVVMKPGETEVRVLYKVTNRSPSEIRFNRVESSCGCTAALPKKLTLGAGESTAVTAVFEKGNRRGKNGSILRVFLEGMVAPVARLKLEVDIHEVMTLQPEILYWREGKRGGRTLELRIDPSFADRLGELRFNRERLQVTPVTASVEKGFYVMTVEPLDYGESLREKLVFQALDRAGAVVDEKSVYVFVRP